MKAPARLTILSLLLLAVAFFGLACERQTPSPKEPPREEVQELTITLGGFLPGQPESEKIDGTCGLDLTRTVLTCDVYNGLPKWKIRELTFIVGRAPYEDADRRYYRVPASIEPLSTEQLTIRLGQTLPPDDVINLRQRKPTTIHHWMWQIVGARGVVAR